MKFKPALEIAEFLKTIADSQGVEIVEVSPKISKNPSLTVYIDKEGGVDLNACESFHKAIDLPLDDLDPSFGEQYTLNVSSSGLDRPFKTDRDFEKNIGKEVEIKLFAPLKGQKRLEGELKSYDGNTVTVKLEKEDIKLSLTQIAKIHKAIKF